MKIFKNQKGVTLIEATIGMALTAAAGVAYMTHMQTVNKNEAAQKVRSEMSLIEAEGNDYLKSRDICNENVSLAFDDIPITGKQITSERYFSLMNKGFLDSDGIKVQKPIFEPNKYWDGGKIWVKNVEYKMNNIQNITIPSTPWNKSATLDIMVTFERCSTGGIAYHPENGVKGEMACTGRIIEHTKKFTKMLAFRTDPSRGHRIEKKTINIFDDATQKWIPDPSGKEKMTMACADSQDALVEAAKEYTDLKACVLDMKMMMLSGKMGTLPCGITLSGEEKQEKITTSKTITLPEKGLVPNSVKARLVGGGGGGGAGGCSGLCTGKGISGNGGYAGEVVDIILNVISGGSCKINIGRGGYGGNDANSGEQGVSTEINCNGIIGVAKGGAGGEGRANKSTRCGKPGRPAPGIEGSVGGDGRCKSGGGSFGRYGGGGGGGSGRGGVFNAKQPSGMQGGSGLVAMSWMEYKIEDPEGVLQMMGEDISNYMRSPANVPVPKPKNIGCPSGSFPAGDGLCKLGKPSPAPHEQMPLNTY